MCINILRQYLKQVARNTESWQLYSNENTGLQQLQMESCQPIKRLKDKKKKKNNILSFYMQCDFCGIGNDISKLYCDQIVSLGSEYCLTLGKEELCYFYTQD
jgi:hypothetical protein